MRIAILALQGAFAEHGYMLDKLGAEHFEVRQKKDLEQTFDGLILPGGESTVMGKLLQESQMMEELRRKICEGMPVFGTCAGMILLAKDVEDDRAYLGTMDIRVKRNAYGRQLGSFYRENVMEGIGEIPMTFIRAPYIMESSDKVQILARVDEKVVAARQENQLVTAFHPELTEDVRVHRYFLEMIYKNQT